MLPIPISKKGIFNKQLSRFIFVDFNSLKAWCSKPPREIERMGRIGEDSNVQGSPHDVAALGSPLNPHAVEFASGHPERQKSPPEGPANSRQRANGYSGSGRGRGRGQSQLGMPSFPPHAPSRLGRQLSQSQVPQMMPGTNPAFSPFNPFGGAPGFQPMFPGQFPPPMPSYVGFPVMAYPPPPPGFQHPQTPFAGPNQGPMSPGPVPAGQGFNETPPKGPARRASVSKRSAPSTPAQPKRTTSISSQTGSKRQTTPAPETPEEQGEKYWQEFETARDFEDDYAYFPNSSSNSGK
ncbi:hypothetical protein F5Y10DRAFT_258390 [Nemania abortiva]|nr:hypothetical protein F5Y10DRAFT_258390 [Nemania abortiva]